MAPDPVAPTIVVVVLDCVRASDFPSQGSVERADPPAWAEFCREARSYSGAVAPGSWTIPSHASLLTGKYPWDHRAHAKGTLPLAQTQTVLPELLRPQGYRSLLLSGNPMLDKTSGLCRGFDAAYSAKWWEPLIRGESSGRELTRSDGNTTPRVPSNRRKALVGTASRVASELAFKYPFTLDVANRVHYRLAEGLGVTRGFSSPWIERGFSSALETLGSGSPFYCLINYYDAHEPYLTDPRRRIPFAEWWRRMSVSQQMSAVLSGHWTPTPEDRQALHQLYLESMLGLKCRVNSIIETLVKAGRWEDALFVVTSDHGQAFAENDYLFHAFTVDEEVTRIPLMIKFPHGSDRQPEAREWVSLVDLHATIVDSAGLSPSSSSCGRSLLGPPPPHNEAYVYCLAEGLGWNSPANFWLNDRELQNARRVQVAAYNGAVKLVYSSDSDLPTAYRPPHIPGGPMNRVSESLDRFEPEIQFLEHTVYGVKATVDTRAETTSSTDQRLISWGYF